MVVARLVSRASACAAAVLLVAGAQAQDIQWASPTGGVFSDGANWLGGVPPSAGQGGLFDLFADYSVGFVAPTSIARLVIQRGHPTFDVQGHLVGVPPPQSGGVGPVAIRVGATNGETPVADITGGMLILGSCSVATEAGSRGMLQIRGAQTEARMWGSFTVGSATSQGSLLVADAASVYSWPDAGYSASLQLWPGSTATVNGAGLRLRSFVATGGTLTVENGGGVSGEDAAFTFSGDASLVLLNGRLGFGSALTIEGEMYVLDGSTVGKFSLYSVERASVGHLFIDGPGSRYFVEFTPLYGQATVTGGGEIETPINGQVSVSGSGSRIIGRGLTGQCDVFDGATYVGCACGGTITVRGVGTRCESSTAVDTHLNILDGALLVDQTGYVIRNGAWVEIGAGSAAAMSGQVLLYDLGATVNRLSVHASGSLSAAEFHVAYEGTGTQLRAELLVDGAMTLTGPLTNSTSGRVGGSGSIAAASISNSGLFAPGGSHGVLSLSGPFAQAVTGTLEIEVSSAGHDVLDMDGPATLGGTIRIIVDSDSPPIPGSTLDVLLADSVSGFFSSVELVNAPSGLPLSVIYQPDRVSLFIGCTVDFDRDGDYGTDADVESFLRCLGGGCCGPCGSPDFDSDGDVGTDADIETFFSVLGGGPC